jgi:hypothetical protein
VTNTNLWIHSEHYSKEFYGIVSRKRNSRQFRIQKFFFICHKNSKWSVLVVVVGGAAAGVVAVAFIYFGKLQFSCGFFTSAEFSLSLVLFHFCSVSHKKHSTSNLVKLLVQLIMLRLNEWAWLWLHFTARKDKTWVKVFAFC